MSKKPHSYVAIERDENAAAIADRYVQGPNRSCCIVSADQTGLATGAASFVYGEAMLTMQGKRQKRAIVAEAARLLRTGGRYAIHEICFVPDELPQETRDIIEHDLAKTIRVATQPLTIVEWREVLTEQGFKITSVMFLK